jgi:hypothetical protein
MLMGQSILRIHNRDDDRKQESGYKPYGMFGNYKSTDCFAVPVEDEEDLSKFESLFHLQRKNNSGLSIVVPFVTEEITINHLAYSVIEQYFYPILEGKLEVELVEEDNSILLEKHSIQESIDKINFEELANAEDKKIRSKESLIRLLILPSGHFICRTKISLE